MRTASVIRIVTVATLLLTSAGIASAKEPASPRKQGGRQAQAPPDPGQKGGKNGGLKNPPPGDSMSPVYIQQMFDAMAVMEAERFLPLSAEQYPNFVQRLRRLHEARMQFSRRRTKALNELRGLTGAQAQPDVPDSLIDAKLKDLAAAELDGAAAVRKALDDLDMGLSMRQRARYRLLEENVERRKIDFLTKVRGGGSGPGFEGIPR